MPKDKPRNKVSNKALNIESGRPPLNKIQPLIDEGISLINQNSLVEAGLKLAGVLEIDPDNFDGWNLLGIASLHLEDANRALQYFDKAIEIDGKSPEARFNRALALIELNDTRNAEDALRTAIALRPNYTEAWNTLGLLRNQLENWESAREALEKALASDPNYAQAWVNLCGTLQNLDLNEEAIEAGIRGIELSPDIPQSFYNLATAYYENEEWKKAIAYFDQAIAIDPDFAPSYVNKSPCLCAIGKFEESEQAALKAIELNPEYSEAYNNLGLAKFNQNDLPNALRHYRKAIELEPDSNSAHNNFSYALLMSEEFSSGWNEYEYGFDAKQRDPAVKTDAPIWDGQPIDGKRLYVHGEQGVGEQIMFSTILPDLVSSGARVIYECDMRLAPLFDRSFPDILVVPSTVPPDPLIFSKDIDYRINIGSLGKYFRHSVEDFVPRGKFLESDQVLADQYRKAYRKLGSGHKIGISWKSSSPHHGVLKNAPLELWKPILETPNCHFISLQYGEVEDDIKKVKRELGIDIFIDSEVNALNSLEQCAAQTSAVDLVISISNATIHIAAACGTNTWMMLDNHALWHWFLERRDSLWYEHVRKFRPGKGQSMENTIDTIARELPEYLENWT